MTRPTAAFLLAAFAVAAPLGAVEAQGAKPAATGQLKTKPMEVGKLFPYLNLFYRIPAKDRTLFGLAYYVQSNRPLSTVKIWNAAGEYPIGADGRINRLPSAEQLRRKEQVNVQAVDGASFGLDLELESKVAATTELDAAALKSSVDQSNRAIKGAAGVVRFAVPTMGRLVFKNGGSGQVVLADGSRRPLAVSGGAPVFDVAAHPTARTVTLARAPSRIFIQPAPKAKKS